MDKSTVTEILKEINLKGHTVVFCGLHGSHVRKINTSKSDKDYKVFVMPTLDDLYTGEHFKYFHHGDKIDVEVKDIRDLPKYVYNCSPSGLDMLCPMEYYVTEEFNFILDYMEPAFCYNPYKTFMATNGTYQKIRLHLDKDSEKYNKNVANLFFYCSVANYIFEYKHYFPIMDSYIRDIITNIKKGDFFTTQLEFIIEGMDKTMESFYKRRDELPREQNDSYMRFYNQIKKTVIESFQKT